MQFIVVSEKLEEFNRKSGDGVHQVDKIALEEVMKLCNSDTPGSDVALDILKHLLNWPEG